MINEDIRHIVEAELREGEELLWAEELELRPIAIRGLFKSLFPILFLNVGIAVLYISGLGDLSTQTIITLLMAGNFGAFAIFVYETYSNYVVSQAKVAHAITSIRVLTMAWNKHDALSITQILLEKLSHYKTKKQQSKTEILFLECLENQKPKAKFLIHTNRNISEFVSVISPFLESNPS